MSLHAELVRPGLRWLLKRSDPTMPIARIGAFVEQHTAAAE